MAVYTKIEKEEINKILLNYKLGKLKRFEGIKEGIENTNYSVETEKGKYVLTIYERRVKETDLPFFSNLMFELSKNGFMCPKPISNKENRRNYRKLKGRRKRMFSTRKHTKTGLESSAHLPGLTNSVLILRRKSSNQLITKTDIIYAHTTNRNFSRLALAVSNTIKFRNNAKTDATSTKGYAVTKLSY